MAKKNAIGSDYTNNADGWDMSGGTTARKLTLSGADVAVVGSGTNTYTFPASTDTIMGLAQTETITGVKTFTPGFISTINTVVTSQFDKTANTTLANITGLSATLVAAKTYVFEAFMYTTSNVAGGVKFAIAGTATATSIIYECLVDDSAVLSAQTRATALGTAVGGVTAVTVAYAVITGTIVVNAGGTLTVQFAQNASNGAASSVLVGSSFMITRIT